MLRTCVCVCSVNINTLPGHDEEAAQAGTPQGRLATWKARTSQKGCVTGCAELKYGHEDSAGPPPGGVRTQVLVCRLGRRQLRVELSEEAPTVSLA